MKKGLIRKGLVFSVIVLFIGVGIQPVFAVENRTPIVNSEIEEECIECQESDRISLLRVKILLFRVKVVTNILLSSKLGEIPEIEEDCQELLDIIDLNSPLDGPIIICGMLWAVRESILGIEEILQDIFDIMWEINQILAGIFLLTTITMTSMILTPVNFVGVSLGCWEWFPD